MPKKPIAFRLEGKPFSTRPVSKMVRRTAEFVGKLRDGELLTARDLCGILGYGLNSFRNNVGSDEELVSYRVIVKFPKRQVVWGNLRTIAELRKNKKVTA